MVKRLLSIFICALIIFAQPLPVFADDAQVTTWERVEDERFEQDMAGQKEETQVPAAEPGEEKAPLWLRIGLKYGSSAVSSSTVTCDSGFILADVERYSCEEAEDLSEYTSLYVECSGGKVFVYDEKDGEELFELGSGQMLMSADPDPDSRIVTIDGSRYRDGVSYRAYGDSMSVINRVTLEHYVPGVVANEMGYTYPAEALKAQAVTARSYAVCSLGKHGSYGFDLCTGQNCQVYRGVSSERQSTTDACRATEDMVITYEDKPVSGYYYAYSSGWTLDSQDVWTSQPGYLLGVKDEYAEEYLWKASVSFDSLRSRLNAAGYSCGEIQSVSVKKKLDNGAVYTLTVSTDSGDIDISKSAINGALSTFGVKSLFFYISGTDYPKNESRPVGSFFALGGVPYEPEEKVYVVGADGEAVEVSASDLYILRGKKAMEAFASGKTSYFDEDAEDGMLYMTGFGWGHSVGMPQVSAKNMALAGRTYDEILKYYYTGIEIRSLHGD